jgi:hypothetical protein
MKRLAFVVAFVAAATPLWSQAPIARLRVASIAPAPDNKVIVTLASGEALLMPQAGLFHITSVGSSPTDGKMAVVFGASAMVSVPVADFVRLGAFSPQRPNVLLRFVSITPAPEEKVMIKLASGAAVAIREADLLTPITSVGSSPMGGKIAVVLGTHPMISVPEGDLVRVDSGGATTASQAVPTFDFASKCAKDWPTDFSVRAYCEEKQREALATLRSRSMTTPDQRTIRSKCAVEWPEDYSVRNYCEERQLEALRQLGR